MLAEVPEHIEALLAIGPEGAAAAMSDEQLQASLVEWAGMLADKPPYTQKAILGNLAIFINELSRRLNEVRNKAAHEPRTKTTKES